MTDDDGTRSIGQCFAENDPVHVTQKCYDRWVTGRPSEWRYLFLPLNDGRRARMMSIIAFIIFIRHKWTVGLQYSMKNETEKNCKKL